MPGGRPPWNHNIHYHPLVLAAVPPGARTALDVGCGEGMLARELRSVVPSVTGIDRDGACIERARELAGGVEYVEGDVLTHPFQPGSFDLVASIAVLHHMGTAAGLERMAELLRPGGVLAVVGLPRPRLPHDLPYDLAGMLLTRWYRARRGFREVAAPTVWPPPETYAQVRRTASRVRPGVRVRRHVLWRYSLLWTKPVTAGRGPAPRG